MTPPKPPSGLSAGTKRWWERVVAEYAIEDTPTVSTILEHASRTLDRVEACRKAVDRDGLTIQTRFGEVRPHPMLLEERMQRGELRRLLGALGLETETPGDMRYQGHRARRARG